MTVDSEQKKMIDKVTKLLALADGTEHSEEADTARKMAIELMAKYNITLGKTSDTEPVMQDDQDSLDDFNSHAHYSTLVGSIARFCDVFVMRHKGYGSNKWILRYIGTPAHLEAFAYMKDIVIRQRNDAMLRHILSGTADHETSTDRAREQWFMGFAYGVSSKINELMSARDQKLRAWGIVPVKKADLARSWYEQNHGALRKGVKTNPKYLRSGYQAGREVQLNKAVSKGSNGPLELN